MYLVLISTFTIKAPGYTMHDRKWFSPLFSSEEPPFVGATTVSTQCHYVWILQQEFACQRNVLEIYVKIFFMMQTATFFVHAKTFTKKFGNKDSPEGRKPW